MIEDLYITGSGAGIVRTGAGTTVGYAAHILELGAGLGAGLGIIVAGGEIHLKVLELNTNTAYNVGASGVLRLDANKITGGVAGTGPAYVNTAGFIAGNPADWGGSGPPRNLNTAIDRIAAVVAANHGAIP
jgi:hypothetical protein